MKRTWLWIILIILILALASELTYYFGWYKTLLKIVQPTSISRPMISPVPEPITPSPSVAAIQTVIDPGVTWITPQKLSDLGLTTPTPAGDTITITNDYYKIADLTGGGELILDVYQSDCPCLPELLRFKKAADGTYTYLLKNSDEKDASAYQQILTKNFAIDYNTVYQSLSAPDFLTVGSTTLKAGNNDGLFSDISATATAVGETSYGKLYRTPIGTITDKVAGVDYSLKLADSTYATYVIKFPFQTDDEIALLTWSDGTTSQDKFTAESYTKCGMVASDNAIIDTTAISTRLQIAGKTNGGDNIYTVAATDDVMKAAYANYTTGRDKDILTIDQFATKKPLFIWQSAFGDYIVFTDRNYGGLAECGKPVVYLYPTQDTNVLVKIAATITKSDPTYNNGWQVLAHPTGELTVDGKSYSSLFWEGQGIEYPIVNQGVVVKQADVASTLTDQIKTLGLNDKESADFLAFWLPKMPKTPYVRLTWFGTKEMDKLAPMTISPKPDTIIRIFLDSEGLSQPITIKPQVLDRKSVV